MSITRVQQTQISGSLSFNESMATGGSMQGQANLKGDLDALRSLVLDIKGENHWYDATTQDLAQIYAAMQASGADATMQGQLSVTGALLANGDVTLGNSSSDKITFAAKADSALDMNTHKVSNLMQASSTGDALGWGQDASVSDLIVTAGDFTVTAAGHVAAAEVKIGGDVASHLYFVGASGEIQDSADLRYEGSKLFVSGAAEISNGLSILAGGLEIAGDKLEVTGSFAITGDALIGGKLSIAGDVATRLYIVDGDGSIKDEAKLTFDGSKLVITGSADLTGASDLRGAVHAYAAMTVEGAVSMNSTLSVSGSSNLTGNVHAYNAVEVDGAVTMHDALTVDKAATLSDTLGVSKLATFSEGITVNGAVADFNDAVTANKISIDSDVATRLYIVDADGSIKDESKLTFDGSKLTVDGNVVAVNGSFSGDVTVSGDLHVNGSMTYIQTENLKVKDALIHLATGSAAAASRGVVLHGGSGSGGDLAVGAKAAGYDFILAKNVSDTDVDSGNSEIFAAAELAGAWMSSVKIGSFEGTELAHLAVSGSSGAVKLSVGGDLGLQANGSKFNFAASGDQAAFELEFGAVSIISAIVAAASGGNFKKGSIDATAGQALLDFSSVGTLRPGYDAEKDVDVYLNGVLLASSDDYALSNDHTVSMNYSFAAGDKMTIIIRNAA